MPNNKKSLIPFNDYLGLYCKAWLRLKKQPTQVNLAYFTLSKHLLIEKSRNSYKRKGQRGKVFDVMVQVQQDLPLAESYAHLLTKESALAKYDPLFTKAGLI